MGQSTTQPPHRDSRNINSSTVHNLAYKGPTEEGHVSTSIALREIVTFTLLSNPKYPLLDMTHQCKIGLVCTSAHTHAGG